MLRCVTVIYTHHRFKHNVDVCAAMEAHEVQGQLLKPTAQHNRYSTLSVQVDWFLSPLCRSQALLLIHALHAQLVCHSLISSHTRMGQQTTHIV